jgi:hypothetical protein
MNPKWFLINRVCITETLFQNKFQILFYRLLF